MIFLALSKTPMAPHPPRMVWTQNGGMLSISSGTPIPNQRLDILTLKLWKYKIKFQKNSNQSNKVKLFDCPGISFFANTYPYFTLIKCLAVQLTLPPFGQWPEFHVFLWLSLEGSTLPQLIRTLLYLVMK